ncbi:glycoside hydrolase family 3 C-terminal domain-containing protein [Actinocorallia longicatena]|uniref:Probable beta-glucosidase G n=1 Tax=Actinocorallia longicatena TaxID=111803 RepID=A0ABP6QM45_9ACTN
MAVVALLVAVLPGVPGTRGEPRGRPWENAGRAPEARAAALLAAMTLPEKLTMLHGGAECGYVGCVDGNARLGIPPLHLQDGPAGVGQGLTGVTQLAAPVAAAATWDTGLMRDYGRVLGAEQWGKGANVELGPTVNIVRDPRWGRAFESFGEDPHLAAEMGVADIEGIQSQGPMAQIKHFMVYNQETHRRKPAGDAVVSERARREIYSPAFEAAVRAGVGSVMCSYNRVNGAPACENGPLQNGLLKTDFGFSGFVTSDWGATYSTVPSALGGLDMEMPDDRYFGAALTAAVADGRVPVAVIDDKVRRILTAMFRAGLFDRAMTGTTTSVVTRPEHVAVARRVAAQGSVLLKNTGLLPLTGAARSIAVLGAGAGPGALTSGGGSAGVIGAGVVTPYAGIKARAGAGVTVGYSPGTPRADGALPVVPSDRLTPAGGAGSGLTAEFFPRAGRTGAPVASRVDPEVDFAWNGGPPVGGMPRENWSARWTGTLTPPATGTYTFSLTSDDGGRLTIGGARVIDRSGPRSTATTTGTIRLTAGRPVPIRIDYGQLAGGSNLTLGWRLPGQDLHAEAVAAAEDADVAVVVAALPETESRDLGNIDLPERENRLVAAVAAVNPRTVVVITSGSAVTMPWLESVPAVVEAWYPGQEFGNALASLLFGDEDFTGRLPVTFPKSLADVPAHGKARFPGTDAVHYDEGVDVGYRWYDRHGVEPLFPFGHGLSYTTYAYTGLTVTPPDGAGNVTVAFDVTNTGGRDGAEIAQVYVDGSPASGGPPRALSGFRRIPLKAGQTRRATVVLPARAFQHWADGAWTTPPGQRTIRVGSSSRDLRLTGTVPEQTAAS